MKAITLHQPWASLIADGFKHVETRSWPTNHRGPIAIHAGRTPAIEGIQAVDAMLTRMSGTEDVRRSLFEPHHLGCVVATAIITDCVRMTADTVDAAGALERAMGDWRPDRYAWHLEGVQMIDPVVCRGAQGLWELPAEVERDVMRQFDE